MSGTCQWMSLTKCRGDGESYNNNNNNNALPALASGHVSPVTLFFLSVIDAFVCHVSLSRMFLTPLCSSWYFWRLLNQTRGKQYNIPACWVNWFKTQFCGLDYFHCHLSEKVYRNKGTVWLSKLCRRIPDGPILLLTEMAQLCLQTTSTKPCQTDFSSKFGSINIDQSISN